MKQGSGGDLGFRLGTGAFALLVLAIVVAIGIVLFRESSCRIREFGFEFWLTDTWDPVAASSARGRSSGARSIRRCSRCSSPRRSRSASRPTLSELCPPRLRQPLIFLTELLAAIPSIVYGLWGMFVLVPLVRRLETAMPETCVRLALFSGPPIGLGMLSAALILAVMVTPFISSLAREVLKAVPRAQREGAYALGATQWEAIRVALAYGRTGIVGAIMLGFGRALGETMAVTMVIGNNPRLSLSLFAPQYTMAAVIANEFTEAADELHLHALIEIGWSCSSSRWSSTGCRGC